MGVKEEDGISNGVRTEARWGLNMGLEMGLSKPPLVTEVWLPYCNPNPVK